MTVDAQPVRGTEERFRAILAARRLERSAFGRMSRLILRIGRGVVPSRELVTEMVRRDIIQYVPTLIQAWQKFSGESIPLVDLMPTEAERAKLVALPKPVKPERVRIPMPEGRRFIGVTKTPGGRYQVSFRGKNNRKFLGTFDCPFAAGRAYDDFARNQPSYGRKRELNFAVDPGACSPEPVTRGISLERAA